MNRGEPILRFSSGLGWIRSRSTQVRRNQQGHRAFQVCWRVRRGEATCCFNVQYSGPGNVRRDHERGGPKSLATDAMHRLWSCSPILLSAASGWWRLYCTTTLFFGQRMSTTAQAAFVLSISESRLASAAAALPLPGKIMLTMQDCALVMQSSRWRC